MGERKGTSITKHEARRLLAAAPDNDFIAVLAVVLGSHRCSGWLTINEAADLAGSSARTLQRKLAAEKVTFSGLIERVRADLAAEMLCNTDIPLEKIAKELGYSAVSNFSRAFRSWTGKTPSEFRRSNE